MGIIPTLDIASSAGGAGGVAVAALADVTEVIRSVLESSVLGIIETLIPQ